MSEETVRVYTSENGSGKTAAHQKPSENCQLMSEKIEKRSESVSGNLPKHVSGKNQIR